MVNIEMVRFRIHPYAVETALQIVIDIIVILLVAITFAFVRLPIIANITVCALYLVIALFFHYRIIILAFIDSMKQDYVTDTVSIQSFDEEYSFSGNYLGKSHIHLFWPKDMNVQRYKISVLDNSDNKKNIRAVMSSYRKGKFSELYLQNIDCLELTYLRRSKILVNVDLPNEIVVNNRKRKEKIDKTIRAINKTI